MTDLASGPVFTDRYWDDTLGVLGELREKAPVREVELPDGGTTWLLTRYDDVRAALADARLVKDFRSTLPADQRAATPGMPSPVGDMMLLNDPPVHTRLRKLVVQAFTVRRVAALRPRIEQVAAALLDALPTDVPVDLVETYALPLPMAVICELLGVPAVDRDAFGTWARTMIDEGPEAAKHQASASLAAYLYDLIERRRAEPDDALISALVTVSDEGDRLSQDEVAGMAMLLLIAGHETTSSLIGTGTAAVLRDPALRARLQGADERGMRTAVEELLRWAAPVATTPVRFAAEDVEIGGATIPHGALVMLSLTAANHDPHRFAGGELLDPDRDAGGHLAFGHGIHFCLGASLARLEAEVAFSTLLRRFPDVIAAPDQPSPRRRSVLVNAFATLPVVLGAPRT